MTSEITYRVRMTTKDGSKLLDPTIFPTRKAAEMRIAAFLNREGCRIVRQRTEEPCK